MIGFYNIIKPTGMGSTNVVSKVRHITGCKVGHLGTLDPMAGGVLPVAVGKATKLFDYFLNKDKKYFAICRFGVATNTLDSEGEIITQQNVDIKKTQIEQILGEFCGKISQIPPNFCSAHINGERAYTLARQGKSMQIKPRDVTIYSLKLVRKISKNLYAFYLHCSAGTYVRAVMRDIAARLGTVATTVSIIRLASGNFDATTACTIEDVQAGKAKLVSVGEVVDLPKLSLTQTETHKLLNGQNVKLLASQIKPKEVSKNANLNCDYLAYDANGKLIGIVNVQNLSAHLNINLWE